MAKIAQVWLKIGSIPPKMEKIAAQVWLKNQVQFPNCMANDGKTCFKCGLKTGSIPQKKGKIAAQVWLKNRFNYPTAWQKNCNKLLQFLSQKRLHFSQTLCNGQLAKWLEL